MSRPDPRLVPTLTEVLDDAHWQASGAREVSGDLAVQPAPELAPSEPVPAPVMQPVGLALLGSLPSLDLPDLSDPVLDLSEEALALHAQEEASPDLPLSQAEPQTPAEVIAQPATVDDALQGTEGSVEESLRAALISLGPRLAEALAPLLIEQLGLQIEALVEARVEHALRVGRPDFPHGEGG